MMICRIFARWMLLANGAMHGVLLIFVAMQVSGYAVRAQVVKAVAVSASHDEVRQALIAKERQSWELAIKGDGAAYRALHSSDFITVGSGGVSERGRSEDSALDANVRFEHCDFSGFGVRFVTKDTALVTYRVKAAGLDHGKAFALDSYASSLWRMEEGRWLNVFYQSTSAAGK